MTSVLLRQVDIVTLDDAGTVLEGADLLVVEGRIAALGEVPVDTVADEVLDGRGKIVLPGLVNAHCHSPMTLQRGAAEDMAFAQWLPEIWRIESSLEPEDIYWGAALAAVEMIKTGVVAFNCMYFQMGHVARVVEQSGLRATLGETVFDPGAGTSAADALEPAVQWTEEVLSRRSPRLRAFLAPHSPYTCSQPLLERVVEEAHRLGAGVHLHVAEDQAQVEDSLRRYGRTPVQHLESIGLFEAPGGCVAAHTLVVDELDVEILARRSVHIPHCPITYAKLAMPMFPLSPLLDAGVPLCLGTDGPASNSDMDLFAVMRQTALLQKYLARDPASLPGDTLLRMATRGGAQALGLGDSGVLREGAAADLILLDGDAPHLQPRNSLIANLVHSAKGSDVTHTMVDGVWLMRDRQLQTFDEAEVVAEARRRGERLYARSR
jgi:5-methylthioadenosine/S-adenosylhomocysteine deaminase